MSETKQNASFHSTSKEMGSVNHAFDDRTDMRESTNRSAVDHLPTSSKKAMEMGAINLAYVGDGSEGRMSTSKDAEIAADAKKAMAEELGSVVTKERVQWANPIEFLMSCIAMSVGLGNVWRFPFTAYDNGGGAFLIPYIIVLLVIGRPMYFMEMSLGQFTSYSAVRVWSVVPALKGLGWGMVFVSAASLTYYCSLMALTVFYFVVSFSAELPWSVCAEEWGPICFDSKANISARDDGFNFTGMKSSSELYFTREVLKEKDQIDDGIGYPEWRLTLCLLFSWVTIFLLIIKGVKSSGKAAYFLALFPYVVLIALFIRGVTLPGSWKGILFFIEPQWGELLNPRVWYAAVTQAFFSLSVGFGSLIMYSSYNGFTQNIHRDALIVTSIDTFTSILAGCTIFAILGNLAHEMGVDDISQVVKGDAGLAFISYPEAIAKFDFIPQLFAVLFFLMLYTLGIGSAVAGANSVISIVCDQFRSLKYWKVALGLSIFGFLSGLIYVTPGGQWMLTLVDYYCVTFVVFVLAVVEVIAITWVYGFDNFCKDINFMLRLKLGAYWRICWGVITPAFLLIVLVYSLIGMEPKQYDKKDFPPVAYTIAWTLAIIGLLQIPLWAGVEFMRRRDMPFIEMVKSSFRPSESWGPKDVKTKKEWNTYKERKSQEDIAKGGNLVRRTWRKLTGFDETD